jgi:hypothetical protein
MSKTVPFRPSNLPTNLVAYWAFNGNANDSSVNGYTLTPISSPVYVSKEYWNANSSADLTSSSGQYFTRDRNANLDLLNAFTISGWINPDDVTTTTIVQKNPASGYSIEIDGSSKLTLYMNNSAVSVSNATIPSGKWTNFVYVYSQTDVRLFLNGNLESQGWYATDCSDTSNNLFIGVNTDASTGLYDGKICDLAFWATDLGSLSIKSIALGIDIANGDAFTVDDITTPPTAYWKLNEVSGNAIDSSGNGLDGTDTNTVASTGGYIDAIARDFESGSSQHFVVGTSPLLDITTKYSISCWIKFESIAADQRFFFKWYASTGYMLIFRAAGALINVVHDGTEITTGVGGIVAGIWYHFAIAYDTDNNTIETYLDGKQYSTACTTDITANTGDLGIGSITAAADYFDGVLAHLAFWNNYYLTASEVKALATGLPIQRQGIVSYWNMDEASGTRYDSIGVNHIAEVSGPIVARVGMVDSAASLDDASTQYFKAPSNGYTDGLNTSSSGCGLFINVWAVEDDAAGTFVKPVVSKGSTTNQAGGYCIYMDQANNFVAYQDGNSVSVPTVGVGSWYNIQLNCDNVYDTIYVQNKDRYNSGTPVANLLGNGNSANLTVGATTSDAYFMDGGIDELLIAARYFREEERKAIYLLGLNGMEATSGGGAGPTPEVAYEGISALTLLGCGWG